MVCGETGDGYAKLSQAGVANRDVDGKMFVNFVERRCLCSCVISYRRPPRLLGSFLICLSPGGVWVCGAAPIVKRVPPPSAGGGVGAANELLGALPLDWPNVKAPPDPLG